MKAKFFRNLTRFFTKESNRSPYDTPLLMTQRSHWHILLTEPPVKKYLPYLEGK